MKFRKVVYLLLTIFLFSSVGVFALVGENSTQTVQKDSLVNRNVQESCSLNNIKFRNFIRYKGEKHKEHVKGALNSLVKEGRLSEVKAEKIMKYLADRDSAMEGMPKENCKELKAGKKAGLFCELIEKEIITVEEADMIKTRLSELREKRLKESLEDLTKKGIITDKDAEAVKNYLVKLRNEKSEKFKQLEKLSPQERNAYFKSYRKEKANIFENMVKDGILTRTQAEELKKAISGQ